MVEKSIEWSLHPGTLCGLLYQRFYETGALKQGQNKFGCTLFAELCGWDTRIRGHYHKSFGCFESPKNPSWNRATQKNTCQIFLPNKILRSSPSLEIPSITPPPPPPQPCAFSLPKIPTEVRKRGIGNFKCIFKKWKKKKIRSFISQVLRLVRSHVPSRIYTTAKLVRNRQKNVIQIRTRAFSMK